MKKHPYSADRPHEKEIGALPGRNEFAKHLASDIAAWNDNHCLVMALYGGWGAGKSSLKNLVKIHLLKTENPIKVLDFNPWQYSGKADLTAKFFNELSELFKTNLSKTENSERISTLLLLYAAGLYGVGGIGKIVAAKLAFTGNIPLATMINYLSDSPVQAANMMKTKSDQVSKDEKDAELSEGAKKTLIAELLSKLDSPILVIIDDIDRLAENEILEVMQLVKSNADFPKLIFLLLCERGVVATALNKISSNRGDEFLEKIVQVSYHVPHATRKAIHKELNIGLDTIIVHPRSLQKFSSERWRDLFNSGIETYFRNLRHVYRFLGSFNFHFRHFLKEGYLEVNAVDLIGLETLRVFEPALYERLPDFKRVLTRERIHLLDDGPPQAVIDAAIEQILANVPTERREKARFVLAELFPPILEQYEQKGEMGRHESIWLGDARACHEKMFDKYFTLVVPETDLSTTELFELIEATSSAEKFTAFCLAIAHRGLLETAMSRLVETRDKIPVENIGELINGLFSLPIPYAQPKFFDTEDLSSSIYRIAYFSLLRVKRSDRFLILEEAIKNSLNLFIPVLLVAREDVPGQSEVGNSEKIVNAEELQTLKHLCLLKFDELSTSNQLASHPRWKNIFGFWLEWAPEKARAWVLDNLDSPEMCVNLLRYFSSTSTSESGVTRYSMKLSSVEHVLPVDLMKEKLRGYDRQILNQVDRQLVDAFWLAVRRKDEGKPDLEGIDLWVTEGHAARGITADE